MEKQKLLQSGQLKRKKEAEKESTGKRTEFIRISYMRRIRRQNTQGK